LPALATGLLLILCHFTTVPLLWVTVQPVAWGLFAWVALVPLLCLVRSEARPWRIYLSAWAGGLLFFWIELVWMTVAHPLMVYTWMALATWCSLFFPLGIFLVRRLDRRTRLPLVVTLPVVWTGLELIRAHLLTGFAWYFLGHTQHNLLPVIQIADLGGAYAVTFVVAAVNALLFELLYTRGWFRAILRLPLGDTLTRSASEGPSLARRVSVDLPKRPGLRLQALGVVVLVGITLGYGFWRLGQNDFEAGPRLALVQGNVPQAIRNARHDGDEQQAKDAVEKIADSYFDLHERAVGARPRLIVWPETSYPADWDERAPDFLAASREQARKDYQAKGLAVPLPSHEQWRDLWLRHLNANIYQRAQTWQSDVLVGLNAEVVHADNHVQRFNSALLLHPGVQYGGRYDKVHRVPFGEYVPFLDTIPAMKTFAPYDHDYSVAPGEQLTRFPSGGRHFGVVICFEDSDPYLTRQFARPASASSPADYLPRLVGVGTYDHLPISDNHKPVDFLVNISNDGWFDGTSEHEEHLAICRFRAVECRRTMARAVNMGISAVIDPNGRVLAPRATSPEDSAVPIWEINWDEDWKAELPPARWSEFKKVEGVLLADVPIDSRQSFYARWGDWLPAGCWLVIALGLFWPVRRRSV
jgi:apolipoprotein N-acyltransferase